MNKTKKQLAIEEHWAAVGVVLYYGVRETGELGFTAVDENGWAVKEGRDQEPDVFDVISNGHTCERAVTLYRPKSLRGIENNNGWLEGLPPLTIGTCWLQTKDMGVVIGVVSELNNENIAKHWEENVTGWQPCDRPLGKIY